MPAIPAQSQQKPNIRILDRVKLGDFVTKAAPPDANLREGEWMIMDPTTDAWARALNGYAGDAIKACFPVIGKQTEHMNKALRQTARGPQGAVPLYLGSLPMVIETKMYDSEDSFGVGSIVEIGTITVDDGGVYDGITFSGFIAGGTGGIPAGRVLRDPSTNGNWLRVLVTFC